MKTPCTHADIHPCADCPEEQYGEPSLTAVILTFVFIFASLLTVLGLVIYTLTKDDALGAEIEAYFEVPKEQVIPLPTTWEHTFVNNTTGEELVMEVTQAEYDAWLQETMTVPNTPPPYLEGYTWKKAVGAKSNYTVSPSVLSKGEYITLTEDTATTTASYKVYDGTKETITTTKP